MTPQTGSIKTLFFDWDGTVVDSAQLGLAAYEKSFAVLGVEFDREAYKHAYSPNWYLTYEALGLPKEKWKVADELWVRHYDEGNAELVSGAGETILALREKGYQLGIVSSGNDCRVEREIRNLGLSNVFEVVVCNEQMTNKKPHPEGLQTAMRLIGCEPPEACYVGDSPEDIEMGRRAAMFTVGVRSGYPTNWKLQSANPDVYVESLYELLEYF